ncbi:MAG: SRPBCC family protein [Rubricoccaceae bacterium]|nr:SRPBCC family protein [Rubricoccaceae bacterium]
MAEVSATTDIAAPPDTIWALLCDPRGYPELADPTDRMLSVPDEPMGVGSVYREVGGIEPFKGESTWRVTVFEPMRRQVHVGDDGSMTMDLHVEIEPTAAGCRYTQRLSMTPRWYLRPVNAVLWPLMMRRRAQEAMDKTVQNVKRLAEQSAQASGVAAGG